VKPNVIPDFCVVFGQNFLTNVGGKKVVVKMAFRPRLLNVEEVLETVFDGNDDDFSSDDDSDVESDDYIIDMDLEQDVHDQLLGDDSNHSNSESENENEFEPDSPQTVSVSDSGSVSDNVAGARGRGTIQYNTIQYLYRAPFRCDTCSRRYLSNMFSKEPSLKKAFEGSEFCGCPDILWQTIPQMRPHMQRKPCRHTMISCVQEPN
jgi:hypothetical protein